MLFIAAESRGRGQIGRQSSRLTIHLHFSVMLKGMSTSGTPCYRCLQARWLHSLQCSKAFPTPSCATCATMHAADMSQYQARRQIRAHAYPPFRTKVAMTALMEAFHFPTTLPGRAACKGAGNRQSWLFRSRWC